MKILILQTDLTLNQESAETIMKNVQAATENGILILDKRWTYEVVEINDLTINKE